MACGAASVKGKTGAGGIINAHSLRRPITIQPGSAMVTHLRATSNEIGTPQPSLISLHLRHWAENCGKAGAQVGFGVGDASASRSLRSSAQRKPMGPMTSCTAIMPTSKDATFTEALSVKAFSISCVRARATPA